MHLLWAARTRCALCPCPQLSARTDHPARGVAPSEAMLLQMVKDAHLCLLGDFSFSFLDNMYPGLEQSSMVLGHC